MKLIPIWQFDAESPPLLSKFPSKANATVFGLLPKYTPEFKISLDLEILKFESEYDVEIFGTRHAAISELESSSEYSHS